MHTKRNTSSKTKDFRFDVKDVSGEGVFKGYASVFGVLDYYREIVVPGAFAKSIAARDMKENPVPVLWQHQSSSPIGVYTRLQEDTKGLYVEGQLILGVKQADEAHLLMKAKAVSGLSIGYQTIADSYNEKDRIRSLTELDLQEASVVTFPACDPARIDVAKAALAAGELPTVRQFEEMLREHGFTKSQARSIVEAGFKALRGEDTDAASDNAIKALVGLRDAFGSGLNLAEI